MRRPVQCDQSAERDTADRGVRQPGVGHDLINLVEIAIEAAGPVELAVTPGISGQGKADHTAATLEGVDGRPHPFPSALDAGDEQDRWSGPDVNHA